MLLPTHPEWDGPEPYRFLGCLSLESGQIIDVYVDLEGPIAVLSDVTSLFYVQRAVNSYRSRGWHGNLALARHFSGLHAEHVPAELRPVIEPLLNFVRLYNDGELTLRKEA